MSDSPLSSTTPSTRFRSWFGWLFLSASLVAASGVAAILNRLWERADECRRVQTELVSLQADAYELDALEWNTIFKEKLNEETSGHMDKIRTRMNERFSRLLLLGSLPRLEEFTKDYRVYLLAVDQEFKLIAAAKIKEAQELDEANVDPAFDALETALEEIGDAYGKRALRTLSQVRTITFLVLFSGVGFVAVLFWQFNKRRRVAEVAAAEQRVLRQANANLESRVGERTAELSALNKQMESLVAERTRELQQSNHALQAEVVEHERAEGGLRASQQIIDGIINAMPVRVFWKDKNLVYLGCNATFARDAGFADPKDVIGKDDFQMGWRDRADLYRGDDRQVIESGCSKLLIEEPLMTPEGNTITILTSKIPLRSSEGEISGVLGTFMDITERKRAEESLRRLQNLHEAILDSAAYGIHGIDSAGRIVFENAAAVRMLGWEEAELIGKSAHATMHHTRSDGTDYPSEDCHIYHTLQTGKNNHVTDEMFWRKDGSCFPVEYTAAALHGPQGEITGAVVVFTDIAERKRAQDALRQSEGRFRSLSAASPLGIFQTDATGRWVYTNERWCEISGQSLEESLGFGWNQVLHAEDRDRVLREWQEVATQREQVFLEYRILNVRKEKRWISARLKPMQAAEGIITGWVGTIEDVTERKLSEVGLEQAHREFVAASRKAGMAEIATNVLHNVGNVLNSVNISASLVVESMKTSRTSSLAKVVGLFQEHEQDLGTFITSDPKGKQLPGYLAQLSDHLLADQTVAILELDLLRGNIEHIKEIVAMQQSYATFGGVKEMMNVVNLVEDSVRMNQGALSRHGVEVIREFETVPPMNIEKHKMLQILINLVRNAKHACRESDRADKRLTVRVANGDGRVRISFLDNGIGIPPENLTRIFNHGFTTKKDGHGFGLHSGALAAKEMGGSLTAHSDGPGQGALFTLELPCPAQENSHE